MWKQRWTIDVDSEADRSQARLWPIRIKLAGPWKRLGHTVGHEKKERGDGGGTKRGNILVIKTK